MEIVYFSSSGPTNPACKVRRNLLSAAWNSNKYVTKAWAFGGQLFQSIFSSFSTETNLGDRFQSSRPICCLVDLLALDAPPCLKRPLNWIQSKGFSLPWEPIRTRAKRSTMPQMKGELYWKNYQKFPIMGSLQKRLLEATMRFKRQAVAHLINSELWIHGFSARNDSYYSEKLFPRFSIPTILFALKISCHVIAFIRQHAASTDF